MQYKKLTEKFARGSVTQEKDIYFSDAARPKFVQKCAVKDFNQYDR